MKFTRLFVERPTLVTVFLCLVIIAGTISGFNLVKQQLPNYDIPSIQSPDLFRCIDDGDARRDRAPARRPDRRRAGSQLRRDQYRAGASLDRGRLFAHVGREHGPRPSAGPRAKLTAPVAQRSADAADLDLQSVRSRRCLARGLIVDASLGGSPRSSPTTSCRRSSRFKAFRTSRRTATSPRRSRSTSTRTS